MPHFSPWLLRSLLATVSVALAVSGCGASTNNGGPPDTGGSGGPDGATTGSGGIDGTGGTGVGGTGGGDLGTGGNTKSGGATGTGSGGAGGNTMGGAGGAKSGGAGGAKSGGGRTGGAGLDGHAGAGGTGNGGGGKGGATTCGTIAGLGCPRGSFCEFPAATCSHPDNAGVCRVRPDICPTLYAPVCGCDGKTYSNDCGRQGMGVSKAADGACATAAGGAGGASMTTTSYAGCRFIGGIDRLVIAKYDAQASRCVALVLADNSGIPAFTGLTITAPWYAESANLWPSTSGDCARRDAPSGALHATSGSGTVTVTASSSTITVDATMTFRAGDSGAPQTADLKKQSVSTSPACP